MQFRRSYIPLVPRTATYSGSLTSRSPRKRSASTQTDEYFSQFENWFLSTRMARGELALDEETTKAYSSALEYVNSFHSYMNRKLGERYGERGDTRPEGKDFFRLPEVPNYAVIFLMLLEKTRGTESTSNDVLKGKADSFQSEVEAEEYTMKESVIEFVPENASRYKLLEETGGLEEFKINEQEAQKSLMDDNSVSCATKTRSGDLSTFPPRMVHSTTLEEAPEKTNEEESTFDAKVTCDTVYVNQNMENGEEVSAKHDEDVETVPQRSDGLQTVTVNISEEEVNGIMMDIIRERVQEEITTYLDKTTSSPIKSQRPQLVKAHFHVVSIAPQINLLEYAQKKLERQLNSEPRPETARRQFLNDPPRKSPNVGLSKVTTMFRKLSQETFRDFEVGGDAARCESDESDGDSVILDDEEFEKINGHVDERMDHKQKRNCSVNNYSATKEKSNPLKLTVRDMSRVNEKVLNTIGLFTERGDVRPGVIDILEEQKRAKAKDSRNKQFRSRRQWDVQIHLDPKDDVDSSFTSVSTEKSFISLSSVELASEFETVKNVSQQMEFDK